jgi:hypothetical protein
LYLGFPDINNKRGKNRKRDAVTDRVVERVMGGEKSGDAEGRMNRQME